MRNPLTTLGRIPMHGATAAGLLLLAAFSVLGAVLGRLPQRPQDLLASLLVCVLVTLAANLAVSLVLRAPIRICSPLITGLLLYFIMWPGTGTDLLAAALAGVIAVVSKFLLVPFGRRLVNPAAFGALVVAVLGVGAPVWWVATGWMLLPVLVIGALVLWRAGGWDAALVAGVLYLCGTVAWQAPGGTGLWETLRTVVVSYPVVFFCLFMVTEPLAAGASRWQRLAVAAVMGLLASRPLHLEVAGHGFTLGPEFALVVGNVVATVLAVVVSRRGRSSGGGGRLVVSRVRRLSRSLVEVWLRPRRPVGYAAGQAVELTVPRGGGPRGNRRVFSLVGVDHQQLRVIFRVPTRASRFKLRLAASPGLQVRSEGVRGDFVPDASSAPLLLVARGVGVTPFLAWIEQIVVSGSVRDVVLVHVLSEPEDVVLTTELVQRLGAERVAAAGVRIKTSGPGPDAESTDSVALLRTCPDAQGRRAAVSGSPRFVTRARRALHEAGVGRVRTDTFLGY